MSFDPPPKRNPDLPREVGSLRLFEEPFEGEMGRIVYQGRDRPDFGTRRGAAHEYWFVEKSGPRDWRVTRAIASFERGEGFDRHIEELVAKVDNNAEGVQIVKERAFETVGGNVFAHFEDGSIRFTPDFTKREANYREKGDPAFDDDHKPCATCVHYIPGEGCHMVRGRIKPDEYCEEFFADYGVFGHRHENYVEKNMEMFGGAFDWDERDVDEFVDDVEEALERVSRQQQG